MHAGKPIDRTKTGIVPGSLVPVLGVSQTYQNFHDTFSCLNSRIRLALKAQCGKALSRGAHPGSVLGA
jgi:hypothetical protein